MIPRRGCIVIPTLQMKRAWHRGSGILLRSYTGRNGARIVAQAVVIVLSTASVDQGKHVLACS